MKPTICAAIIARNEERDIPKCIRSLAGAVDQIVLVDTGSTDNTYGAAIDAMRDQGPFRWHLYLEAGESDGKDGYRIVSFAKARNEALRLAREAGCSHIFVIDADDVLETPLALCRAAYMPRAVYAGWNELDRSGLRQVRYCLFPADAPIEYKGWCHEYLVTPPGMQLVVLNDLCIRHDSTPHEGAGEDSNARNLRILLRQWEAEPDARCAFYLANTHKDGGRFKEAIPWYYKRLGFGVGFRDEFLFAVLFLARCHRAASELEAAAGVLHYGLALAPDWQEFRMELAYMDHTSGEFARAIDHASRAIKQPQPATVLWREKDKYTDQPARLISFTHETMGSLAQAIVWAELAAELIGGPDADWDLRTRRLKAQLAAQDAPAPAIVKRARQRIALHRPGAIGDILMTLNLVPALKAANPDAEIHYFCDAGLGHMDALGSTILASGIDCIMDAAQIDAWRKSYELVVDLIGYPIAEGYPERPMARHLLNYFACEMGLGHEPIPYYGWLPQLMLPLPACPVDNLPVQYATIQITAGWSKYKEWPIKRWEEVVAALHYEIPFVLIGGPNDPPLVGTRDCRGLPLRSSLALVANAAMHVGIDSWANHATNYLWTYQGGMRRVPGVILWGSTQATAAGYPDNTNISKGLHCQPCFRETAEWSKMKRGPCVNTARDGLHQCMNLIKVAEVIHAILSLWEAITRPEAA